MKTYSVKFNEAPAIDIKAISMLDAIQTAIIGKGEEVVEMGSLEEDGEYDAANDLWVENGWYCAEVYTTRCSRTMYVRKLTN